VTTAEQLSFVSAFSREYGLVVGFDGAAAIFEFPKAEEMTSKSAGRLEESAGAEAKA
jgi:hypothetical protein